jgi:hypothetical protein
MFGDKTAEPMRVVNAYIMPILKAALEKHQNEKEAGFSDTSRQIGEDDTLLDHLVRYIKGVC